MRGLTLAWVVSLSVTVPLAAQQPQPSLGDLARRVEAERASGVRKATKTYTNANLAAVPASEAPPEPSGYISATTGKAVSPEELIKRSQEIAEEESAVKVPESYWRQQGTYLHSEFARAQGLLDNLQKAPPSSASLPAQARYENEVNKVRQMIAGLEKQWSRLEASARQAKINMEWIGAKPTIVQ